MKLSNYIPKWVAAILFLPIVYLCGNPTSNCAVASEFHPIVEQAPINVVILGLGRRAQDVLLNCLNLKNELHREIRVLAVSDDNAHASLNDYINSDFIKQLSMFYPSLVDEYKKIFEATVFYSSSDEDLERLFSETQALDQVFITSPNYDHSRHLRAVLEHSDCQRIYMEKPLFCTLDELENSPTIPDSMTIDIGLTLRYSTMARIVSEKIALFKDRLGPLKKIHSWEHEGFGHNFTIFMMNWRRSIAASGGFLLDKSIHDIDLAFFFVKMFGLSPNRISLKTETDHTIYKKSNQQRILQELLTNAPLRENIESWNKKSWQRMIQFEYSSSGEILWKETLDNFFEDFPQDDCFDASDIIPDNYKVSALLEDEAGESVEFELEVKVNDFDTATKRGVHFECEFGSAHVDVMKSEMSISLENGESYSFDLCGNNTSHTGGDTFIAHSILGNLPPGHHKATFNDPIVQLSMTMGLIAEYQAKNHLDHPITMEKIDGKWCYTKLLPNSLESSAYASIKAF